MSFVSFNLVRWQALAPGLSKRQDWQSRHEKGQAWTCFKGTLPIDKLPPMMRRRMSFLSKMAVQTALMLSNGEKVDYIISSSRHGELSRTTTLLEDILSGKDASPTFFSQSVHNTAASHFTIIRKNPIPVTSIGAGANSLIAALTEAGAYLSLHPRQKVILVDFDAPIPSPYDQLTCVPHPGYALGLLLTSGDTMCATLTPVSHDEPVALDVIDQLLRETDDRGKPVTKIKLKLE